MTNAPEPYHLYAEHLAAGDAAEVELKCETFRFQFHGPTTGIMDNWLKVERVSDGLTHRFGPGHCSELVWRAYYHAERGWEKQPMPAYKEVHLRDQYDPPLTYRYT